MAKKKKPTDAVVDAQTEQKSVAVQQQAAVPMSAQDANAWGTGGISAQDIIIPRVLLLQPMSDAVTNGEGAFGDFRESLSNEKIGDFKEGFEVIPFAMKKVWVEYDVTAGDDFKNKKFHRVVDINPANENLPYKDEEKKDGKMLKISRDRCMNFYVLLPKDIEMGGAIPHILTARRSSLQAGKKLATQMFVKNISAGKTPASVICKVTATKETNDAGTFAVMDITPSRPALDNHVAEAFKWLSIVQSGKAKEDVESYAADEAAPSSGASAETGPSRF
jgi:hypothetical protein